MKFLAAKTLIARKKKFGYERNVCYHASVTDLSVTRFSSCGEGFIVTIKSF